MLNLSLINSRDLSDNKIRYIEPKALDNVIASNTMHLGNNPLDTLNTWSFYVVTTR